MTVPIATRLIVAWFLASLPGIALAAEGGIHLPTPADAVATAAPLEGLLNGKRALETRIPGPVTDREHVDVSFGPSGKPIEIEVVQRLLLSGLGDFSFKIPGPATDVEGLPGSDEQPGLRRGAVLWQGFSPGRRELGAVLHLDPAIEASRLPLGFHIDMTVDGRPLLGDPMSGRFSMVMRVDNRSSLPVTIPDAASDAARTAAALDATRMNLDHGARPVPGEDGLPTSLPLTGREGSRTSQIEAPFSIHGLLRFPPGSLENVHATNGTERKGESGIIAFEWPLGGGAPLARTIRVTGVAHELRLPHLVVRAVPAPPTAASLLPPGGGTWARFAAEHPDAGASRMMVRLLLETLWRTARLAQFDAYLGNPDATGPAATAYTFRLIPKPERPVSSAVSTTPEPNPTGIAAFSVAMLALIAGLAIAWARS